MAENKIDGLSIITLAAAKSAGGGGGASSAENVTYDSTISPHTTGSVAAALSSQSSQIEELTTDKADKTALALTDKKLDYLAALTKGQAWSESTGTTPAYSHTVAKGAKAVEVKSIGGKTIKYNQLCEFPTTEKLYTNEATCADGVITLATSAQFAYVGFNDAYTHEISANHKLLAIATVKTSVATTSFRLAVRKGTNNSGSSISNSYSVSSTDWQLISAYVAMTETDKVSVRFIDGTESNFGINTIKNIGIYDLTEMGADSTVTDAATAKAFLTSLGIDYTQYNPYSANVLLSADVTSVVSKEDDGTTTMGTLSIPQVGTHAAFSALYPLRSAGTVYDEIDITNKKHIKRIGTQSVTGAIGDTITLTGCDTTATTFMSANDIGTLASGVLTLTSAATAETVYFPLATAVETDISAYFTDDNLLDVEYNGTVTFTQANTVGSTSVDVRIPVPNGTTYMINNAEATT